MCVSYILWQHIQQIFKWAHLRDTEFFYLRRHPVIGPSPSSSWTLSSHRWDPPHPRLDLPTRPPALNSLVCVSAGGQPRFGGWPNPRCKWHVENMIWQCQIDKQHDVASTAHAVLLGLGNPLTRPLAHLPTCLPWDSHQDSNVKSESVGFHGWGRVHPRKVTQTPRISHMCALLNETTIHTHVYAQISHHSCTTRSPNLPLR